MEEVRKSTWIATNWRIWHDLRDMLDEIVAKAELVLW